MSHTVEIRCEVRDPAAMSAACRRLGLAEPEQATVVLFNSRATGLAVKLPGWSYPAVFDTANARVQYDNYGGEWGDIKELDRFLQAYAVEKASIEARKRGHTVSEQSLADGSIKLVVQIIGGAA